MDVKDDGDDDPEPSGHDAMRHPGHAPCQGCLDRGLGNGVWPEHGLHTGDPTFSAHGHDYHPIDELAPGVRLAATNPGQARFGGRA